MAFHATAFEADYVISLQDAWVLKDWGHKDMRWLPRMPIDTDPISEENLKAIEGAHRPLALTRWGQQQLQDHGWLDAGYIPHGIDTGVYRPADRAGARAKANLPDTFIAGMVACNASNPSRKSFPEVLLAWKQWKEQGGPGILYLHTTVTPYQETGIDFQKVLGTLGLDWSTLDDPLSGRRSRAVVLFPSQYKMWASTYDDEALAALYNAMDVLLSPSQAEGFGIPIVEAQACGVPVVTLAVTSMPELTWAGKCLEPIQRVWEEQGGWRGIVGVPDLVDALDWAQQMSEGTQAAKYLAEKGRENAKRYDFDRVVEDYWIPLLEQLEDELE